MPSSWASKSCRPHENPARSSLKLNVSLVQHGTVGLKLYDATGRLQHHQEFSLDAGENEVSMELENGIAVGFLEVTADGKIFHLPLILQPK